MTEGPQPQGPDRETEDREGAGARARRLLRRYGGPGILVLSLLSAAAFAGLLAVEDRGGPPHVDVVVGEGIPGTLYVPGELPEEADLRLPDVRPPGERPPLVVLAHGFSADRVTMSSFARSLASAGYGVLAIDFRGHGENPNPFGAGRGGLVEDLRAAVDWAADEPQVDGSRLVLVGHSMGADAVLRFAQRDPRPDAVVAISGGESVEGPRRPPNVLFVVASRDPGSIKEGAERFARLLVGEEVGRGEVAGSTDEGTAVSRVVVDGTDHGTILWSKGAVEATVAWADSTFGRPSAEAGLTDPRVGSSGLYLLASLVLLIGLGVLAGRLAPILPEVPRGGAGRGLLVLGAAMLLAMPFTGAGGPAGFLSLAAGAAIVSPFVVAGGLALAGRGLIGRSERGVPGWLGGGRGTLAEVWRSLVPALVAFAGIYIVLAPFGLVYHRLVPTPSRALVWVVASLLFLPFFIAFETLVRRGGPVAGALLALAGRVLVLVLLYAGATLGLLPGVVIIYVPILAGLFVAFELFAVAAYATGRNVVLIALVSSAWLGWITAVTLPIGG